MNIRQLSSRASLRHSRAKANINTDESFLSGSIRDKQLMDAPTMGPAHLVCTPTYARAFILISFNADNGTISYFLHMTKHELGFDDPSFI